jgi:hypothetical protein
VRVKVLGAGLLAETTRAACQRHFDMGAPADILWVCIDTPVVDDIPDVEAVLTEIDDNLPTPTP